MKTNKKLEKCGAKYQLHTSNLPGVLKDEGQWGNKPGRVSFCNILELDGPTISVGIGNRIMVGARRSERESLGILPGMPRYA